jgi:uncharacterized protein YdeI (YjbR/CyaY-like superfamily)
LHQVFFTRKNLCFILCDCNSSDPRLCPYWKKNKYISPNILHVLCHYQKCMLYFCEQFLNWFKVVLELIHDNSWTNSIQVLESITIVLELIHDNSWTNSIQVLESITIVLELIHNNSWTNSIQVLESITIVLELIPYILELVLELLELFKCNSWTILRTVLEQCLNSSQGK